MPSDLVYDIIFLGVGVLLLILSFTWKKLSYSGGVVRKYGAIILGVMLLIYGFFTLISAGFD